MLTNMLFFSLMSLSSINQWTYWMKNKEDIIVSYKKGRSHWQKNLHLMATKRNNTKLNNLGRGIGK